MHVKACFYRDTCAHYLLLTWPRVRWCAACSSHLASGSRGRDGAIVLVKC